MRWVLCKKKYADCSKTLSKPEVMEISDFFELIEATKYCPEQGRPGSIVFLASEHGLAQSDKQNATPAGFEIRSASIDYMPLAYNGIEDEFQSEMQWFYDLPPGYKNLKNPIG